MRAGASVAQGCVRKMPKSMGVAAMVAVAYCIGLGLLWADVASAKEAAPVPAQGDEIFHRALVEQVKKCWSAFTPPEMKLSITLHVTLNPDGSVQAVVADTDKQRYVLDSHYRAAFDGARRAIYACSPFKIPAGNAAALKDLLFVFDASGPLFDKDRDYGNEARIWDMVANSRDPADLRGFLARFPSGQHVTEARQRLIDLGEELPATTNSQTSSSAAPVPLSTVADERSSEVKSKAEGGEAKAQTELGTMYSTGQGVPKDQTQAVLWFRRAAEQGYGPAQRQLGLSLLFGTGGGNFLKNPNPEGLAWLTKAANQGDVESQFTLGNIYSVGPSLAGAGKALSKMGGTDVAPGLDTGLPSDASQAITWYEKAAQQGHVQSQTKLVTAYATGLIVPKNEQRAAFWARTLAEHGDVGGQLSLGAAYALGQGVPKDKAQALYWFRKAAEQGGFAGAMAKRQIDALEKIDAPATPIPPDFETLRSGAEAGDAEAEYKLGTLYGDDKSVLKNDVEAATWVRKAAEQGYPAAEARLADMYFMGTGVPKDGSQVIAWTRRAAEHGNSESQIALSNFYFLGWFGVPKDNTQGILWLKRAAEQGDAKAQYQLGLAYQLGQKVPKDDAQAVEWYQKAAEQGNTVAQYEMGQRYETGRGVPKDNAEALTWLRRAANHDPIDLVQGMAEAELKRFEKSISGTQ